VVDRGYRGTKKHVEVYVLLPSAPLKPDTPLSEAKEMNALPQVCCDWANHCPSQT